MTDGARPGIPRHWTVEVDGIRWLPRMIDKAHMSAAGTLGNYLMGHSPVDRALLGRLRLTTAEFVQLATTARDDGAVLAALRERGFDEARVRRWSATFPERYKNLIVIWDLDEGYTRPKGMHVPLMAVLRRFERPLMNALRLVSKAP